MRHLCSFSLMSCLIGVWKRSNKDTSKFIFFSSKRKVGDSVMVFISNLDYISFSKNPFESQGQLLGKGMEYVFYSKSKNYLMS